MGLWWSNVSGSWMIGYYSNIDDNALSSGALQNDQDTSCPSHSEHWREFYNGVWSANVNADMSCV